jgi:hypothetical protein
MMLQSRCSSSKVSCKSKKKVFGRTLPTNLKKLFIILYCILKMTQGQSLLEWDPEVTAAEALDSVISGTPGKQCLKLNTKQCWSLKIKSPLIQQDLQPSWQLLAAVLEEHLY